MWLSVYACLFAGTLLNHLSASQSFFGEDRSFFEDLFDNRRHTKRKSWSGWLESFENNEIFLLFSRANQNQLISTESFSCDQVSQ